MIGGSPIMWFDVRGLKIIGRILNNSFYVNPQGPQNRGSIPNFYFSGGPNVGGGPTL